MQNKFGKNVICLIGFLFLKFATANVHHYSIVVNFLKNDALGEKSAAALVDNVVHSIRTAYPETDIRIIDVNTMEDLVRGEKALANLYPDFVVDGLFLNAHGNSKSFNFQDTYIRLSNYYNTVGFYISDPSQIKEYFAPIIGKFHEKSRIVSVACSAIAQGSEKTKFHDMKKIAKSFGLESGFIYLNSQKGIVSTKFILGGPLWKSSPGLSRRDKVTRTASQLTLPVSLPIGFVLENIFGNHGYLLELNDGQGKLFKTSYKKAASSGEHRSTPVVWD